MATTITTIPLRFCFEIGQFCVEENNYFQYNSLWYKAKSGLEIGGCASPILADFVISDLIEDALAKLSYEPTIITKYVDDILLFGPRDEMEDTLNVFNSLSNEIRFTIEYEENESLTYLDMKLLRNEDGTILTDFYMKPTNKGRMLNFASNHPRHQKINVAHNFISRIFTLSSTKFWEKNKVMAKDILRKNGYPANIVDSLLSRYRQNTVNQSTIENITDKATNDRRYVACSYVNGFSEKLKKLITSCDNRIGIGFKPQKTMQRLYSSKKDKTLKHDQSGLVYSVRCKGCEKSYIGQTGRKLQHRMSQHKNDYKNKYSIAATNKNKTSAIHHTLLTGHSFDFDNPKILCKEGSLGRRLTKEMALIKKDEKSVVNLKTEITGFHDSLEFLCSKI